MKRIIILAALLAGAAHAQGLPNVVGAHLVSVHAQSGHTAPGAMGWNNINPGLYARWDSGLTVGFFRNSLYRRSYYAGWTLTDRDDRFAITLGAASGYDKLTSGPGDHTAIRCESTCRTVNLRSVIVPLVVPSVRIGITDRTSARLSALIPPGQPVALHLSIEHRFQ